uniref:Uncharacterized protein n=1 Tax=Branchiostoma floridae TaxID=7739 RepID=C3YM05_BRAFL|eukprot:XP_002602587.1 hypothetical protein BRAFLDRAFT_81850 [Branchiostoma floridae]
MAPVTRACCLDTDRGDGVALLQPERPVFCGLSGTGGPLTCLSGYLTPLHRLKTADLSPLRDERHRDHRWVKGDNKEALVVSNCMSDGRLTVPLRFFTQTDVEIRRNVKTIKSAHHFDHVMTRYRTYQL